MLARLDREIPYDYLIVAAGASHAYFGHDEWEPLAPGLKTIEDALEIRRRVLLAFELAERHAEVVSLRARLSVLERSPISPEEPALPVVYVNSPRQTVLRMVMGDESVGVRQPQRPTAKAA